MRPPSTNLPGATEFFVRKPGPAPDTAAPSPERQRAREALKALLALTASGSGEGFFRAVVCRLSELFTVRHVFLAVVDAQRTDHLRTLAVWTNGRLGKNFIYPIQHTPCERAVRGEVCHFPDSVRQSFTQDEMLQELGAESYVGVPLLAGSTRPAGVLALLDDKPLPLPEVHRDMLVVLAERVGNELARLLGEQALRESEERFHELADLTEDLIWVREFQPTPRLVYLSPAFEQMYGRPRADFLRDINLIDQLIHPEDLGPLHQAFEDAVRAGRTRVSTEFRVRRPDGTERWLADNATIVRDRRGLLLRISGVSRDITGRKVTEQALEAERARFQSLFDQSPDAIFVESVEGLVLDANPAACALHGLSREELLGRHVTDLVPANQRESTARDFAEVAAGRLTLVQSYSLHRDGTAIPVELHVTRLTHEGRPALLLHVRDITGRKEAERALEEERARFRSLFENSPNAIWEADFSALRAWLRERPASAGPVGKWLRASRDARAEAQRRVRLLAMNRSARALRAGAEQAGAGDALPDALIGEHGEALAGLCEALAQDATSFGLESGSRGAEGRLLHLLLDFYVPQSGGCPDYGHVIVAGTDITEQRLATSRLEGQRRVLELIACGQPLEEVLTELVGRVERHCEGMTCCLFVCSEDRLRLRALAAPSLPPAALRELDGESIASGPSTAAQAARTGRPIEVPDYETTPVAQSCRALARRFGVRSGLAYPVSLGDGQVIGVFGCYYAAPRTVPPAHLAVLGTAAALFSVALERDAHVRALESGARALRGANAALLALARSEAVAGGQLAEAVREITEAGTQGVGVARASVWFFTEDGQRLICQDCYDRATGRHGLSPDLAVKEHPRYLAAIEQERLLAVSDVAQDERTASLFADYCLPLGIGSLMDAGIRHGGRVVGILCLEHVGAPRAWTPEQVFFAGSLADVASLVLQAHQRQATQEALRRSEEMYRSVVEALAEGVMLVDTDGRLTAINRTAEEILGLPAEAIAVWRLDDPRWEALDAEGKPLRSEDFPAADTLRTGQPRSQVEFSVVRQDGRRIWISVNTRPLGQLPDGRPASAVVSFADISQRRAAQQELRELNVALEQRVEERTAELASTNRELGEFAYVVTHDLKAPLRGVAQLVEWVAQDHAQSLAPEARRYLNLIRQRVLHLHALVDGLLACARVGRSPETETDVDTRQLVLEILGHLSPPANVSVTVAPDLPILRGNPQRLHQVFQNLLDNALKYLNKPRGVVSVKALRRATAWEFCVADNGPGIDKRHHDRVFQIFQRLTMDDDLPGTGLGLTLVKRIVENRGGKVWIKSQPGEGTQMFFRWPHKPRSVSAEPRGGGEAGARARGAAPLYGELPESS